MQNVFPARELYNSNPCRDMWDSEQLSQAAASCSQGSQNSSTDLFSQSRLSQMKGFSSFDVWSQPTNSQQLPEDEPVKYYMKYMTKPPLFSSESERQSAQKRQIPQTSSYRELIEIQKTKTAERDDRDVLDSFITLLKDYTKEVKSVMDSFKDSIDTTLATKAEQVATAASQSADLIKKLKEDLLEGFGSLRKDLKENEDLKEVISKQNEKIVEQDSQIKMLQAQLKDCRAREVKSMEKHDKYMEREEKLLQKLDEISKRQAPMENVPLSLKQTSTALTANYNQANEFLQDFNEGCISQNSSVMALQPGLNVDRTQASSTVRLHHLVPQTHHVPHPLVQNTTAEAFNTNLQGTNYRQAIPTLDHQYQQQVLQPAPDVGCRCQDEAVVPSVKNQHHANMPSAHNQPNVVHPTAAIAPMRPVASEDQQLPVMERDDQTASQPHIEVVPVPETHLQETDRAFTSPGARAPSLAKTSWPKQSPIAAVHPQIRSIKRECEKGKTKVVGPPCAKRALKEDPFDIFVFDLTSSPEEETCEVQKPKPTLLKRAPKYPVNNHITRSKTIRHMKNATKQKTTEDTAESDEIMSCQQDKSAAKGHLPEKLSSIEDGVSNLRGKASLASKCKEPNDRKYASGTNTPKRPIKASLEDGIPRSKVAQSVFQRSKTSFKRNLVTAKRKLSFDASELFEGLEDDTNIQQITESIRKHAQRKRAAKEMTDKL